MSLPVIAFRTASFALAAVIAWLAYPVLTALVYIGLLLVSATGDTGPGGPLAGPVLILLGAVAGIVCVAVAVPAAIAARAVGGPKGVVAGAAVLIFLSGGSTGLAWLLFDLAGNPLTAAAILLAAATPAALVLALSDVVVGLVTRLPGRARAASGRAAEV
ncbi:hypothetical protein FB381_1641 [Nocardioides albertanoniae]|uniref:Uncharacterized protein n=1 Tax=Nocardioides albertanoniae TaxID=1175486 RepID=A0A543A587_9ACTN|nr:hypothetical protein [Nocardioides albertanoniae]TQL67759.1 hypothetical protein FB381_1641 [Nocardioides albertanoniae]